MRTIFIRISKPPRQCFRLRSCGLFLSLSLTSRPTSINYIIDLFNMESPCNIPLPDSPPETPPSITLPHNNPPDFTLRRSFTPPARSFTPSRSYAGTQLVRLALTPRNSSQASLVPRKESPTTPSPLHPRPPPQPAADSGNTTPSIGFVISLPMS